MVIRPEVSEILASKLSKRADAINRGGWLTDYIWSSAISKIEIGLSTTITNYLFHLNLLYQVVFDVTEAYSGSFFPCKYGSRVCWDAPWTEEGRLKVDAGDVVHASRRRR